MENHLLEVVKPDYATPALYFFSTVAQTMGAIIAIVLAAVYAILPQIQARNDHPGSEVLTRLLKTDSQLKLAIILGFGTILLSVTGLFALYVCGLNQCLSICLLVLFCIPIITCAILSCFCIWKFCSLSIVQYTNINKFIYNFINQIDKHEKINDNLYISYFETVLFSDINSQINADIVNTNTKEIILNYCRFYNIKVINTSKFVASLPSIIESTVIDSKIYKRSEFFHNDTVTSLLYSMWTLCCSAKSSKERINKDLKQIATHIRSFSDLYINDINFKLLYRMISSYCLELLDFTYTACDDSSIINNDDEYYFINLLEYYLLELYKMNKNLAIYMYFWYIIDSLLKHRFLIPNTFRILLIYLITKIDLLLEDKDMDNDVDHGISNTQDIYDTMKIIMDNKCQINNQKNDFGRYFFVNINLSLVIYYVYELDFPEVVFKEEPEFITIYISDIESIFYSLFDRISHNDKSNIFFALNNKKSFDKKRFVEYISRWEIININDDCMIIKSPKQLT